jgi:predicted methyltransferase
MSIGNLVWRRFLVAAVLVCAGCATSTSTTTNAPKQGGFEAVLAGAHRAEANRARDQYRHPAETLAFFGIQPGMTVVELWPGGGWYTEVLAPYLRESGKLYAAHFTEDSDNEYIRKSITGFKSKLAAEPALYDRVMVTTLLPPDRLEIAPAGTADAVLTFRNVHNWMKMGGNEALVMQAAFSALKPGGVFGIVEHRAKPGTSREQMMESGYVTEDEVIRMATAAGFVLEEKSEVNANPMDTAVHPKGVWTLPPTLALGEQDRDKYLAIGESDRMTLRFRKPAQ